ncbi:MAG: YihY/virulence factor BrkB family protein [Armatimonadota bacterium]|nr:YihY/virulence factor BrkB family protein [Armatimonadota bacterium]MDR7451101.1 YihY/virulence factor BrkB family protein [Armatimonadota bacterium]MDR7467294.1 YihY/virulence factor BrkB family protein [Armatimonadota bacterium]MDR7494555.1 YihY/virulence factor BrkB family protein [Armatimonadota bacterium]MDR7499868.1 YihY/virulence factor BrkB family protein [Armatimonadota bacterium]
MTLQQAKQTTATVWHRMGRDNVLVLASSTAYAAVLSVFPLLVAVIALLSLFVEGSTAQEAVVAAIRPYLPEQALLVVRDTLRSVVQTRQAAGALGAAGLFWGATAVAGSLRNSLGRVLGGPPRAFWHRAAIDLGMAILSGLFLSLSVLGSAVLAAPPVRPAAALLDRVTGALGDVLPTLAPTVLSVAAFSVVYRLLPRVRLRTATVMWGTALAVGLFELLKLGFFWYLRTLARYPLVYGPLAGMIVFMVWVYLVSVVVLLGAEVMAVLEGHG